MCTAETELGFGSSCISQSASNDYKFPNAYQTFVP